MMPNLNELVLFVFIEYFAGILQLTDLLTKNDSNH